MKTSEELSREGYLGDGFYARMCSGGQIELYTSDGIKVHSTIWLEPEVLKSLNEFASQFEEYKRRMK